MLKRVVEGILEFLHLGPLIVDYRKNQIVMPSEVKLTEVNMHYDFNICFYEGYRFYFIVSLINMLCRCYAIQYLSVQVPHLSILYV